jgi:hypothetical protein
MAVQRFEKMSLHKKVGTIHPDLIVNLVDEVGYLPFFIICSLVLRPRTML